MCTDKWFRFWLATSLLIHITHCATPLQKLLLDPQEHRKPMKAISRDILQSMNKELAAVQALYPNMGEPPVQTQFPSPVPRAYQVAFRQRPVPTSGSVQASIRNPQNYLVIRNSQVVCSGRNLIRTEDPRLVTFENGEHTCDRLPGCSYFVWKPASSVSEGVVWYCSQSEWLTPEPQLNWVVAVRPATLHLDDYFIYLNSKIPCSKEHQLSVRQGPLQVEEVAKVCDQMGCSFFLVDFGGSHGNEYINSTEAYGQRTYFCHGSKPPKNLVPTDNVDGWLAGVRKYSLKPTGNRTATKKWTPRGVVAPGQLSEAATKPQHLPAKVVESTGFSGPIVMHDYSWMGRKGDVIWNPAIGWPRSRKLL